MHFVRTFIAALLFLAWLPATNCCALAAVFPDRMADCCGDEEAGGGKGGEAQCAKCGALETGVTLSHLQPFVLAAPVRPVDGWLTGLLRALAMRPAEQSMQAIAESPPPARRLWQAIARKALPVRGPSFAD